MKRLSYCVGALALALVAACGGDDDGADDAPAPATDDATADEATATADTGTAGEDDGGESGERRFEGRELNVTSWGGSWTDATREFYTDPFSEETGVTVNFLETGGDQTAFVLLQAQQGNMTVDLMDGSDSGQLLLQELLQEYPEDLQALMAETSRPEYIDPYYLGFGNAATLVVCNPNLVERCPTTAAEFWDVENFPGTRAMTASYDSVMTLALLADGVPADQLFPLDVERSIAKLEEIRPHIDVWTESGAQQVQVMADEEVAISYMWSGRANEVQRDYIPELQFAWDAATMGYGNGYLVPVGAPNADIAFELIRWIIEHPEAQAEWTKKTMYETPTLELPNLVPQEVINNLPGEFNVAEVPSDALAAQAEELQIAWQQFITG